MNGVSNSRNYRAVERVTEHVTRWIGSVTSLAFHTVLFALAFLVGYEGYAQWDTVLLVLTTVVSLEAIYLAIFIQMTVNRHTRELEEVSEDVEVIQEDIGEIQENVQEMQENVEDIQEEVGEIAEEEPAEKERKKKQLVTLEQLTRDVQRLLTDIETLKEQ